MTREEYRAALVEADVRMKKSNGHEFVTVLKTRCRHCGKRPQVKTRCGWWFNTFVDHLEAILLERGAIKPNEGKAG